MTVAERDTTDYRSQKAPSREGKFRNAFEAYARGMRKLSDAGYLPGITQVAQVIARTRATNMFGFWLVWQLNGGFEGMKRAGMSDAAIWRHVKAFRDTFGEHPDDFKMPGVSIDVEEYLRWSFDPQTKKMTRR